MKVDSSFCLTWSGFGLKTATAFTSFSGLLICRLTHNLINISLYWFPVTRAWYSWYPLMNEMYEFTFIEFVSILTGESQQTKFTDEKNRSVKWPVGLAEWLKDFAQYTVWVWRNGSFTLSKFNDILHEIKLRAPLITKNFNKRPDIFSSWSPYYILKMK